MNIKFDNNIPIFIQIVDYLKTYIISGKIGLGKQIPSVRDLAKMFKVNPNTIQKALIELEEERLIFTESTNGKYVTKDKMVIDNFKENYAKKTANEYFLNMQKIGFDKDSAIKYINERIEK